jgi:hypothetical protein
MQQDARNLAYFVFLFLSEIWIMSVNFGSVEFIASMRQSTTTTNMLLMYSLKERKKKVKVELLLDIFLHMERNWNEKKTLDTFIKLLFDMRRARLELSYFSWTFYFLFFEKYIKCINFLLNCKRNFSSLTTFHSSFKLLLLKNFQPASKSHQTKQQTHIYCMCCYQVHRVKCH